MVLLLSFAASLCFAVAYVLQYHEAHEAPRGLFLKPRLLLELARHRLWVAGIGAMLVGDLLQAWALGRGSLAVIEPVLTSSLLFALPLSAAWRRERLRRVEWLGALMVSAGIGLLLGVGSPTPNSGADMPAYQWILVGLASWGFALSLVAAGLRSPWASTRAALIGAAAGVLFGLQDALTQYCLHWFSNFGHLVVSWQPYVLLVTAVYGLTLTQSAYEAGSLSAALPPMAIGEPVIGILIGMFALNEQFNTSPSALAWESVGAIVMVTGTFLLARSPLVLGKAHPSRLRQIEDRVLR